MEENKDYMTTDQILETAGIPLLLFVILIYYGMRLWFMKDISAIRGKNKPPVKDEENYAKVAWKKGNFVANTGRKSKNTEEIAFFTKGKARNLRPDAKKDKAEPGISHYMSGARGMLPTVFDIEPPGKNSRIHQAEKPVQLLQQILGFVTEEKEWVLNQFAGSFSLGEAALLNERNAICIEINEEYFEKGKERLLSAKSRSR